MRSAGYSGPGGGRSEAGKPVRILLVNAFHYMKGGVERTYLDESRWLSRAGHDVAHLAVRDSRNLGSPTAAHFAPGADFGEGAPALGQIAHLPRVLWSAPAASAMERLIREFRPEVAHLHAPSRYLTPSILRPLERAGVATVMTLHDFKPWCTNRILFARGEPCERCKGGSHWHALTTRCVQGSLVKSAVGAIEAYTHVALDAYRHVKLWIAPSQFVYEKAVEFSVAPEKLRVLAHGVEPSMATTPPGEVPGDEPEAPESGDSTSAVGLGTRDTFETPYVFFSGRLSIEKGVALLPDIARGIAPVRLLVAGDGPLRGRLDEARQGVPTLRALGHLDDAELAAYRRGAAAVVVPSLFYEHFCYAAAEALLDERPVVASKIGAIPELVEHEVTGQLSAPGDVKAIASALRRALDDALARRWAMAGAQRVRTIADPGKHLSGLVAIYEEALA